MMHIYIQIKWYSIPKQSKKAELMNMMIVNHSILLFLILDDTLRSVNVQHKHSKQIVYILCI